MTADPLPTAKMTARQIIEEHLGRDLGPIKTMPKDTRRAIMLLAMELQKRNAK